MARIPFVTPADVPAGERAAYDAFVKQRGKQPDSGPYALLLHMPELARRYEAVRLLIREEESVPQPLQEIVMLTVARELDCPYIWYAHAAAAKAAGVRGEIVDLRVRPGRADGGGLHARAAAQPQGEQATLTMRALPSDKRRVPRSCPCRRRLLRRARPAGSARAQAVARYFFPGRFGRASGCCGGGGASCACPSPGAAGAAACCAGGAGFCAAALGAGLAAGAALRG